MKYIPPIDGGTDPNRPWINAQPGAGVKGSVFDARAAEHVQREILAVITHASIAPTDADLTQLRQAIQAMIAAASSSLAKASDAEGFAGTVTNKYLAPSNFNVKSFGSSGYQRLPGGLIFQWGTKDVSGVTGINTSSATFPMTYPTACIGAWPQNDYTSGAQSSTSDEVFTVTSKSTSGFGFEFLDQNNVAPFGTNITYFSLGY